MMTKEQKKAADKLLAAIEETLRHLSHTFSQAHEYLAPLAQNTQTLVDLRPDSYVTSARLKELVDGLEKEVLLMQTELRTTEEQLFPGRRAKWDAEAQANYRDQRNATMEKYAGYTGA